MPFKSESQRKLCYLLKGKGQAGSWDCSEWSEATGGKKLPEHVEDQTEKKALGITNKLKGGVGDNKNPADFDRTELNSGIKEEKEHTNDTDIATEIAVDHLTENPKYYSKEKKSNARPSKFAELLAKVAAARPGLWANIRAKRRRGESPAKPGDEDYPDSKNWDKVTAISEKKAQCWEGYERVPGTTPLTPGSCRPAGKKKKQSEAEKKSSAAWQTSEGKNPEGGLNEKGRASLKAQGHDIKRPQPEGGARKDSFCARMSGMKSKLTSSETANDPDSRINKALRKWKCGSDAFEQIAALAKQAVDQVGNPSSNSLMKLQQQRMAQLREQAARVRAASGVPNPSGNGSHSYSGTVFPDRVENAQYRYNPATRPSGLQNHPAFKEDFEEMAADNAKAQQLQPAIRDESNGTRQGVFRQGQLQPNPALTPSAPPSNMSPNIPGQLTPAQAMTANLGSSMLNGAQYGGMGNILTGASTYDSLTPKQFPNGKSFYRGDLQTQPGPTNVATRIDANTGRFNQQRGAYGNSPPSATSGSFKTAPRPASSWKPIDISGDRRRKEQEMGWAPHSMDQGGEHYGKNGPRSAELVRQYGPTGAPSKTPAPVARAPIPAAPRGTSNTYASSRFPNGVPSWATQGWNQK